VDVVNDLVYGAVSRPEMRCAIALRRASAIVIAAVAISTTSACSGGYIANVSMYERTDDPRRIVVSVGAGRCDELDRYDVHEDADSVRVEAWVNAAPHNRPCPGPLDAVKFILVEIPLGSDLGERTVVNLDGAPIPERAAYRSSPTFVEWTDDPTKIIAGIITSGCDGIDRYEVTEETDRVTIMLFLIPPSYRTRCSTPYGSWTTRTVHAEIQLSAPLGDRAVVDVAGNPIPGLTPSSTPT